MEGYDILGRLLCWAGYHSPNNYKFIGRVGKKNARYLWESRCLRYHCQKTSYYFAFTRNK
jgi:hypothetical protein